MANYYVNTQAEESGDHKLHTSGCPYLPDTTHRLELGDHNSDHSALRAARRHFENVGGCLSCSPDLHKH